MSTVKTPRCGDIVHFFTPDKKHPAIVINDGLSPNLFIISKAGSSVEPIVLHKSLNTRPGAYWDWPAPDHKLNEAYSESPKPPFGDKRSAAYELLGISQERLIEISEFVQQSFKNDSSDYAMITAIDGFTKSPGEERLAYMNFGTAKTLKVTAVLESMSNPFKRENPFFIKPEDAAPAFLDFLKKISAD